MLLGTSLAGIAHTQYNSYTDMTCVVGCGWGPGCGQGHYIHITQYGSTVYLGMTLVVSGQFPCIENVQRGDTAKRDC